MNWGTAEAVLAAILQLVIVFLIWGVYRKKTETAGLGSLVDVILTAYSAAFLTLTVLSGDQADYKDFLTQWTDVLEGRDPWGAIHSLAPNAYGPIFNLLAPLVSINLLANKLLFAFSYLVYVIWLIKDFGPRRGFVTFSWPWAFLLLLNPFPWREIAYLGYFDILVGLACVAAVHWRVSGRDWLSGTYLAFGILLKFMPIVILPFLAFSGRRIHFRLIISCVGVVILGVVASLLVWGTSTFAPLIFAATRGSAFSIYNFLDSTHSPLTFFLDTPKVEWLDKPLLLIMGTVVWIWCLLRRTGPPLSAVVGVLVTLLFYRVGWINYQMVLFVLILYLAVSEWEQFNRNFVITALFGYFGLLTIADLARSMDLVGYIFYSNNVIILLRFFGGVALLGGLLYYSGRTKNFVLPQAPESR